jgi:hypothetical protein
MANSPGAQQNPQYCMLSGALNVSFDGGATWTPIGGGSGGTVSVDGVTITGNGSVGSPLVATAQFGADTKINQLNGSSISKTTWEGISAYTTNTNGAEVSNYTIKTLVGGAQVAAQVITGISTLFPAGTNGLPGLAIGDTGTGLFKGTVGGDFLGFDIDGTLFAFGRVNQFIIGNNLYFAGTGGHTIFASISADATVQNLSAQGNFGGNQSDFVVGASAALATNATGGFLQIPTCAGTPTGTAHLNTGKAAMILDTTANKLWLSSTAGTWKGVVIA